MDELRDELNKFKRLHEIETKKNVSLSVENEKATTLLNNLRADHDDLIEKFHEGIFNLSKIFSKSIKK